MHELTDIMDYTFIMESISIIVLSNPNIFRVNVSWACSRAARARVHIGVHAPPHTTQHTYLLAWSRILLAWSRSLPAWSRSLLAWSWILPSLPSCLVCPAAGDPAGLVLDPGSCIPTVLVCPATGDPNDPFTLAYLSKRGAEEAQQLLEHQVREQSRGSRFTPGRRTCMRSHRMGVRHVVEHVGVV